MTTHFPELAAHRKGRRQKVISVVSDEGGVATVETDIMDYVFLPQRLRDISFVFNGLQYYYSARKYARVFEVVFDCMYNQLPVYCCGIMFAVRNTLIKLFIIIIMYRANQNNNPFNLSWYFSIACKFWLKFYAIIDQ